MMSRSCVLTPDDAWIDPHAAMMGFRRMARHLGVDYRKDRIVDWQGDVAAARHVILASRQTISAKTFVLAAGAWSVKSRRCWIGMFRSGRCPTTHYFLCKAEIEPLPFLKCETDLAFRPGAGFTGGKPDWSVGRFWWNYAPDWFENEVWPALAHRVPALEEFRLERTGLSLRTE